MSLESGRAWSALAGCSAVLALATGCAIAPPPVSVTNVVDERTRTLEAEGRERFDNFLAAFDAQLEKLGVPTPTYQGLVPPERRGLVVADCIGRMDERLRVSRQESGFGVNYFGVVGEDYERIQWTIESCAAQYGLASSDPPTPGPLEIAWLYDDTLHRAIPCLRDLGFSTPSPPTIEQFTVGVSGGSIWNPLELAVPPAEQARAVALCRAAPRELDQRILELELSE